MPAFGNVLLPELSADQMRGVWALLDLIGTPRSQEAQEFMKQLMAVKDEAVAAAAKAAEDRAAAKAATDTLGRREDAVNQLHAEATTLMAEAKALKIQLDTKHGEYMRIFGSR